MPESNDAETSNDELLHEIGGFEPNDAKRVLAALEAAGIPFETEADHRDLLQAGRTLQLVWGMYPPGSKLVIFVPASAVDRAQAIVRELFPV